MKVSGHDLDSVDIVGPTSKRTQKTFSIATNISMVNETKSKCQGGFKKN